MRRLGQSAGIAAFAGEILESLPTEHGEYAAIADQEGQAHLALGLIERATIRYEQLHELLERRAAAEPDRADCQVDLAISSIRTGDRDRALQILSRLEREGRLEPRWLPLLEELRSSQLWPEQRTAAARPYTASSSGVWKARWR